MALSTVRAQINGQWYTLTLSGGQYQATINAPTVTSWGQPNHTYNVMVEATNDAGTQASADGSTIPGLNLRVLEKIAPVITMLSPSNGAYVNNNQQPVVFTVTDETGGSGVNLESLVVKLDGNPVPSGEITNQAIANGYQFTYSPASALGEGGHTVTADVSDNDGNAAAQASTTYTVDTVPPALNITAPADGLITATSALVISGTTNDATSSPVTVTILLNESDQGPVSVGQDGSFSKSVTLTEGANSIVITATDTAGRVSSVTRNVTLDTSVPQIISASITPNPVDAGQSMLISVVIEP